MTRLDITGQDKTVQSRIGKVKLGQGRAKQANITFYMGYLALILNFCSGVR